MSTSRFELSALCRDAFALLQGAEEIKYKDGDTWRLEETQVEHPLVNRLRAASMVALTEDQPEYTLDDLNTSELVGQLKNERTANDNLRDFLVELEALCHEKDMPKTVTGHEVLAWLRGRIESSSRPST